MTDIDQETLNLLRTIGFDEDLKTLPAMKELISKFRKMALLKHPDKPGGSTKQFQDLLGAFEKLGKLIDEKVSDDDIDDEEEVRARNAFSDLNFTKMNTSCFTVFIQTCLYKYWEIILTKKYGAPIDRSEQNNGKQWTVYDFKDDEEHPETKIYITMWEKKGHTRSTMQVQAENKLQYMNAYYVTKVIPVLFEEVIEINATVLPMDRPGPPKKSSSKQPTNVKTSNRKSNYNCKFCDFKGKNLSQLNRHNQSEHRKCLNYGELNLDELSSSKSPLPFQYVTLNSPLVSEFPKFSCFECREGFATVNALSEHEKDKHENNCQKCGKFFFSLNDLNNHNQSDHAENLSEPSKENEIVGNKEEVQKSLTQSDDSIKEVSVEQDITPTIAEENHSETSSLHPKPDVPQLNDDSINGIEKETPAPSDSNKIAYAQNKMTVDNFIVLEKEHKDLLDRYNRLDVLYNALLNEKNIISEKNVELNSNTEELKKEIDNLKKSSLKREKMFRTIRKDLEDKLEESYDTANKYVQENVKLAEEKRALEEIRRVGNLQSSQSDTESDVGDWAEHIDDDDELVDFHLQQNIDRDRDRSVNYNCKECSFKSNTENRLQNHMKSQHLNCEQCNFNAKTKVQLFMHKEAHHKQIIREEFHVDQRHFGCNKCDFRARTAYQMGRHMEVRHQRTCPHWARGYCRYGELCWLEHPDISQGNYKKQNVENSVNPAHKNVPCWYQDRCKRINCRYQHSQTQSCHFQEFCQNSKCQFVHYNQPFLGRKY